MSLTNYLKENFYEHKMKINNIDFRYLLNTKSPEDIKGKEILVFQYGLLCSFEHYRHQIEYFNELGIQILLMDYRAHGKNAPDLSYDKVRFDDIACDFEILFERLEPKQIYLVCHSMGVNVGLEVTLALPNLVKGLVLISGTVFPPQNVMFNSNLVGLFQPMVETFYDRFPKGIDFFWKKQSNIELVKKFVHMSGFNHEKTEFEFIEIYLENVSRYPVKFFFHLLNLMRDHNILGRLHEIKTPTLVVSGDRDQIVPLHLQTIMLEHIENSELYIVKDGNHVPQMDDPNFINERLNLFFSTINATEFQKD